MMALRCGGKISYKTVEEAKVAKMWAKERGQKFIKEYKCKEPGCKSWHLGHNYD